MSRDAVIVSTARTPIGRAYKGGFNATSGATLGSFSFAAAVDRAAIDPGEIDDVVWGAVLTQGTQAGNIGRQVALRAGAPVTVGAQTIDRQCSSGLMAIATAAKQIIVDNMDVGGWPRLYFNGPNARNACCSGSCADCDAQGRLYANARHCRDSSGALWDKPGGPGRVFFSRKNGRQRDRKQVVLMMKLYRSLRK